MTLSIVGAGLGRTGTMTLKLAIEQLGVGRCYHMLEVFQKPEAPAQWEAVADGAGAPWEEIFEGFVATVDWPSATYYRALADAYPQAKVILTKRDPEAWFASTQATIFNRDFSDPTSTFERMIAKVVGSMFDMRMHDHDHLISVFERHNAEVRKVIAPDRLLVYEVAQGWGPLCAFLGLPEPSAPMPRTNTTEEFRARVAAAAAQTQAAPGS